MSIDICIPLSIVLSHRAQFKLKAELNGSTDMAHDEMVLDDPDWDYIYNLLTPVLLCQFGARATWRHVDVFTSKALILDDDSVTKSTVYLRACCGGDFRNWLIHWLEEHNYQYTIH
jgi:hypothetical protein